MDDHDDVLQAKAIMVANAFAKAYNKKHSLQIPLPVKVTFELEKTYPNWAGGAFYDDLHIELNMTLYRDNVDEFLNQVIVHEVAHLAQVCHERDLGMEHNAHGTVWQKMMASMYKKPDNKHNMDTSKAKAAYKANKAEQKRKSANKESV